MVHLFLCLLNDEMDVVWYVMFVEVVASLEGVCVVGSRSAWVFDMLIGCVVDLQDEICNEDTNGSVMV